MENKIRTAQKDRTVKEQGKTEEEIAKIFYEIQMQDKALPEGERGNFLKEKTKLNKIGTAKYLMNFLKTHTLTTSFENQKTWVVFFLIYGLELLDVEGYRFKDLEEYERKEIAHYLGKFWNKDGKVYSV